MKRISFGHHVCSPSITVECRHGKLIHSEIGSQPKMQFLIVFKRKWGGWGYIFHYLGGEGCVAVVAKVAAAYYRSCYLHLQPVITPSLADRSFKASKSIRSRISSCSETPIVGFQGSAIVKFSAGWPLFPCQ